jgi:hypothetical protein
MCSVLPHSHQQGWPGGGGGLETAAWAMHSQVRSGSIPCACLEAGAPCLGPARSMWLTGAARIEHWPAVPRDAGTQRTSEDACACGRLAAAHPGGGPARCSVPLQRFHGGRRHHAPWGVWRARRRGGSTRDGASTPAAKSKHAIHRHRSKRPPAAGAVGASRPRTPRARRYAPGALSLSIAPARA